MATQAGVLILKHGGVTGGPSSGGLGSSCCITQDYKEMYWDFNDLGKSNDLIMKLEINVLYL